MQLLSYGVCFQIVLNDAHWKTHSLSGIQSPSNQIKWTNETLHETVFHTFDNKDYSGNEDDDSG